MKAAPIYAVAQCCIACDKWFDLSPSAVLRLEAEWRSSADFRELWSVDCTHCGKHQIAISVGKYDRPITWDRRNHQVTHACQRVVLK